MDTKRFFGSDPEFFVCKDYIVKDNHSIPCVIPPASLIQDFGMKFTLSKNNKRILLSSDDYNWIEDGSAMELNYKRPFDNSRDLIQTTNQAIRTLSMKLNSIDYDFRVSKDVLGYFDTKKYWEGRDESFIDNVRFGCDPDIFPKLYMLSGFEEDTCKIIDASKHEYRYAGGHIHVQNMSQDSDIYLNNIELAPIIFDFFVGTTNIILERSDTILSQEIERLKYYGRPGRVRLQKYSSKINGLEYRPPSNQWINNPYSVTSILESANISANIVEKGYSKKFFDTFQDRIYDMWDALTKHDKKLSTELFLDSITWALENNLTTLKELEIVYGQL